MQKINKIGGITSMGKAKKRWIALSLGAIISISAITGGKALANTEPVIASVEWVLSKINPLQQRVDELEEKVEQLEAQVAELKSKVSGQ